MESSEYFTLKAHLNSDYPRFKCSIVTCGWWPSNWTAQVSKVTMRMYVRHTYFGWRLAIHIHSPPSLWLTSRQHFPHLSGLYKEPRPKVDMKQTQHRAPFPNTLPTPAKRTIFLKRRSEKPPTLPFSLFLKTAACLSVLTGEPPLPATCRSSRRSYWRWIPTSNRKGTRPRVQDPAQNAGNLSKLL